MRKWILSLAAVCLMIPMPLDAGPLGFFGGGGGGSYACKVCGRTHFHRNFANPETWKNHCHICDQQHCDSQCEPNCQRKDHCRKHQKHTADGWIWRKRAKDGPTTAQFKDRRLPIRPGRSFVSNPGPVEVVPEKAVEKEPARVEHRVANQPSSFQRGFGWRLRRR